MTSGLKDVPPGFWRYHTAGKGAKAVAIPFDVVLEKVVGVDLGRP